MKQILLLSLIIFTSSLCIISCSEKKARVKNDKTQKVTVAEKIKFSKFSTPNQKLKTTVGDTVQFSVTSLNENNPIDSVHFYANGQLIKSVTSSPFNHRWTTAGGKVGKQNLKTISYSKNEKETNYSNVILVSDIVPEEYGYKIVKTYPHDINAYTQGLVYRDGFLYEGTGQYGESSLRKLSLETGELIQSYNLPNDVFGEGIEIFDNKIIQLTWQSRVGYVYDKTTFTLLNKFNFQYEGWGITNYKDLLIMSDGTATLHILEKETFTEVDRIDVYDNNGSVRNLNELENINGEIYANVYGSDYLVVINPDNGKVTKHISLPNLLTQKDRQNRVDVLNGIAYDFDQKRLFVTGKWWPKLFEIELVKK